MRYGSLFSGIAGFDSGFDAAGFDCAWQCEIEPSCVSVLEKHYPNVKRYSDVREVTTDSTDSRPDLICAGWPCQGNSVAGLRGGMADSRSGLWGEVRRVLKDFAPRWFLGENVPGLLSVCGCAVCETLNAFLSLHAKRNGGQICGCARCDDAKRLRQSHSGRDFLSILADLEELGYGTAYRICDAQFWGVAQRRRRVFIVGCLGDWRSAAKVLFESDCLPWDSPPRRETGAGVAPTIESGVNRTGGTRPPGSTVDTAETLQVVADCLTKNYGKQVDSSDRNGGPVNIIATPWDAQTKRIHDASGLAPSLASSNGAGGQRVPYVASPLTAGMSATKGVNRPGRRREDYENLVCGTLNSGGNNGGFRTEPGEHLVTHALRSEGADASEDGTGRGTPIIAFAQNSRDEVRLQGGDGNISGALAAEPGMKQTTYASTAFGVRRLTPTECERLQGFPDGWTEGQSDSARYRMLGNAVAVPVAIWIAKRIRAIAES